MRIPALDVSLLVLSLVVLCSGLNISLYPAGPEDTSAPRYSLWEVEVGKGVTARPEVLGEKVFALSSDGWAVLVDCGRGEVIWRKRAGHSFNSSPVIIGSIAYMASRGAKRYLTAVSLHSGERLWKIDEGDLRSGPVRVGTGLAALASDGVLKRYDIKGPTLSWSTSLCKPCLDELFVRENRLIACCMDTIFSISAEDGQIENRCHFSSPAVFHPLEREGGILVVGRSGEIALLDADSGEPLWTVAEESSPVYHVASSGDTAFITAGSNLICMATGTGEVLWRDRLPSPAAGPPCIRENLLAVSTVHGGLFIYESTSGRVVVKEDLGQPVSTSPVICSNRILVATQLGKLLSFPLETAGGGL